MGNTLGFLRGVDRLHAFYTENVRMLAHAYDLTDEEASELLANTGFTNVSVAILRDPRAAPPPCRRRRCHAALPRTGCRHRFGGWRRSEASAGLQAGPGGGGREPA